MSFSLLEQYIAGEVLQNEPEKGDLNYYYFFSYEGGKLFDREITYQTNVPYLMNLHLTTAAF
jgi:hypothetical protein